jgi:hypothetical protein
MSSSRQEREEDLHAELGYRTAGQREVAVREWFSLQGEKGEPIPTPREFAKVVNRLRVKKWIRENRKRHNAKVMRYQSKPGVRQHMNEMQNERRRKSYGERAEVLACKECGVEWCKAPWVRGVRRIFCGQNCQKRARHRDLAVAAERRTS